MRPLDSLGFRPAVTCVLKWQSIITVAFVNKFITGLQIQISQFTQFTCYSEIFLNNAGGFVLMQRMT